MLRLTNRNADQVLVALASTTRPRKVTILVQDPFAGGGWGAMGKSRSATAVANRTLALFGVYGIAAGSPCRDVNGWLGENGLRDELSPDEKRFVDGKRPPPKDAMQFSWHSERLIVLVWALNLIDELPPPDEQCDTSVLQDLLPPFADMPVKEFIR